MVTSFKPEQGSIILLNFNPQAGHEQRSKRPAFIASNSIFHKLTNLAIVCPITNTARGFPLHVALDQRTKTGGVIMCEQAKSLDLSARDASFIEKAPPEITEEVVDILYGSVEIV